jgi:hypothetical protein
MSFTARSLRLAAGTFTFAIAGAALAASLSNPASAIGTSHAVTAASKGNYSSAVERPTWNFSCNPSTDIWKFSIDNVQVIDSTGRPWKQHGALAGPWSFTVWSAPAAGPVPFSRVRTLTQNTTNGLFRFMGSGPASNAATWCVTGGSVTVVAFSGTSQPLLLDGTLS